MSMALPRDHAVTIDSFESQESRTQGN